MLLSHFLGGIIDLLQTKKKCIQTATEKQQPHRLFHRSGVPVRAWPGSSHIAVTIIRNFVLMANYSISANVFCLFAMSSQGKTQREEKRKKILPASEHTSSL